MRLDAIPIGANPPHEVNVVVEVPLGGEPIKYELDKASGAMFVDRFLYTAMRYPGNYGFIPHTLSDDGDPCDVLVANTRPIAPGAVIAVRPIGVLRMKDEHGGDEKIVAVPVSRLTHRYENVKNYTDLQEMTWRPHRTFLCSLQRSGARQMVRGRGLGRRRGSPTPYLRGDRARQTKKQIISFPLSAQSFGASQPRGGVRDKRLF